MKTSPGMSNQTSSAMATMQSPPSFTGDKRQMQSHSKNDQRALLKKKLFDILSTRHGSKFYDKEGPTPIMVYVKQIADLGKVNWFVSVIENAKNQAKQEFINDVELWKTILLLNYHDYFASLGSTKAYDYDHDVLPPDEYVSSELYRSPFRWSKTPLNNANLWYYYLKYIINMSKDDILPESEAIPKNTAHTLNVKSSGSKSNRTGKTYYPLDVSYLNPNMTDTVSTLIDKSPLWSHGDMFYDGFVTNVPNIGVNSVGIATAASNGRLFVRFNALTGEDIYPEAIVLPIHMDFFDNSIQSNVRSMNVGSKSDNDTYDRAWNYNITPVRTRREMMERITSTHSALKKWHDQGVTVKTSLGTANGCEEALKSEMSRTYDRDNKSKTQIYDEYYDNCVRQKYKYDCECDYVRNYKMSNNLQRGDRRGYVRQERTPKPKINASSGQNSDSSVKGTILDVLMAEIKQGRGKHTAHFHVMENGDILVIFEDFLENISIVLYVFDKKLIKLVHCVTLLKINLKDLDTSQCRREMCKNTTTQPINSLLSTNCVNMDHSSRNDCKNGKVERQKSSLREGGTSGSFKSKACSPGFDVSVVPQSTMTAPTSLNTATTGGLGSGLEYQRFFNVRNYSTADDGIPKSKSISRILSAIQYTHSSSSVGPVTAISLAFLVNVHQYPGARGQSYVYQKKGYNEYDRKRTESRDSSHCRDKSNRRERSSKYKEYKYAREQRESYEDNDNESYYYPYVDEDDTNENVMHSDEVASITIFFTGNSPLTGTNIGVSATCVSREQVAGRFTSETQRMMPHNAFNSPDKKIRIDCLDGMLDTCSTVYVLTLADTGPRTEDTLIIKWTESLILESDSTVTSGSSVLESYLVPGEKSPCGTQIVGPSQHTDKWKNTNVMYKRNNMLIHYKDQYSVDVSEKQTLHNLSFMDLKYPVQSKVMFRANTTKAEGIDALSVDWDKMWVSGSLLYGLAVTKRKRLRIHLFKMDPEESDSLILLNRSVIDHLNPIDSTQNYYFRQQLLGCTFNTMEKDELLIIKEQLNETTFKMRENQNDLMHHPTIKLFCCRYPKSWQVQESENIPIASSILYSQNLDRVCTMCEKPGCTAFERKDVAITSSLLNSVNDSCIEHAPEKWYFCNASCHDNFHNQLADISI